VPCACCRERRQEGSDCCCRRAHDEISSPKARCGGPMCVVGRYRDPRCLVRQAGTISAIAQKSGMLLGNVAPRRRCKAGECASFCWNWHLFRIRSHCWLFIYCDPPQTVDGVCPAKADIFMALSKLLPKNGIEFAWCRLFYLYGEGEDPRRLVPYVRGKLGAGEPAEFSSGREIRDYLDVRDAGRMIADATLGSVQGPVNICSGKPITVREIAETIADEHKRRDLLRFGMRPDDLDPPCVVGIRSGH
jgi:hypothetical protein